MFLKIRNLLTSGDDQKLHEAEKEFDQLMEVVDDDVRQLVELEGHIQKEFGKLKGEVKEIEVEVDELFS